MKSLILRTTGITCALLIFLLGHTTCLATQYNHHVHQAQKALKQRGYNPGVIDGISGPATQRAIKRFQRDAGLPINGQLDDQTKISLGIDQITSKFADTLRTTFRVISKDELKRMLIKHNFFDSERNKFGNFQNDFHDNNDGTVTDKVTRLVWQKSGSKPQLSFDEAHIYILKLNRSRFAGFNDWRLPTVEELASLLENRKMNGNLYINCVFSEDKWWCWSGDRRSEYMPWYVSFDRGKFRWVSTMLSGPCVRAVRTLN